jgi:hypothetical protein
MPASHGHQFDASSPVGQHWLVHGVGFTVCDRNGRKLGIVEDVIVDPERHSAAGVLMRRRGIVRRPRYVTIEPGAIESVLPGPQLFLMASAERRTAPTFGARAKTRALRIAVGARAAVLELARVLRPLVRKVERGLGVAAAGTARRSRRAGHAVDAAAVRAAGVSRRTANTTAAAAVRAAGRTRREAPRVAGWLSARAREAVRSTLRALRSLGKALRRAARVAADVSVTAALLVVAASRRAAASAAQQRKSPPQPGSAGTEWRRDADAPLARDTRGRRIVARRSTDGDRAERR